MTVYLTKTEDGFSKVEIVAAADGNYAFFHANTNAIPALKQRVAALDLSQQIVGETPFMGQTVLVTRGPQTQGALLKALQSQGAGLQERPDSKKSMDPWKLVSMLAVPGQLLQLTASFIKAPPAGELPKAKLMDRVDSGQFAFAVANLVGHVINWMYGSQKTPDVHRLRAIKEQTNRQLASTLPDGAELPSPDDNRMALRMGPPHKEKFKEKFNGFMEEYSVTVGEIFCRYLGAFALAFPYTQWKAGMGHISNGELGKAFHTMKASSPFRVRAGLLSMLGKTIALFSKAPDPYDPKPKTALDQFRENIAFRLGGWTEVAAFGNLTYDSFANNKITIGSHTGRDYVGGAGASLFTLRYMVRHFAKYGEKQLDMDELYAHVTDSLAQMKPEDLPQVMADTTATIIAHSKDKDKTDFGAVYVTLAESMRQMERMNPAMVQADRGTTKPAPDMAPPLQVSLASTEKHEHSQTPTQRVQFAAINGSLAAGAGMELFK